MSVLWQPVLYLDLSGLQQPVLPSYVSALQQSVLSLDRYACHCTAVCTPEDVWPAAACASPWKYMFNSSLFCASSLCYTWTISLHEHVLHLDVSVYWRFCVRLTLVSVFKSLCCTCVCLTTRASCCIWTFQSTRACAAPVRVCLQELMCCTCMDVSVFKSL